MSKQKKYLYKLFTATVIGLSPFVLHAAYLNPINIPDVDTVPKLLLALVDLILLFGVPIMVICIIYSGFLFVTGGDNESQVAKAKFVLTWTLLGGLVLFGAKAIALAIQGTVLSLT